MTKPRSQTNNAIRKMVFKWYSEHKSSCDDDYSNAIDPNFSSIYEDVSSEEEKNLLFAKTDILILTANKYERNILHYQSNKENNKKIKRISIKLDTAIDFLCNVKAYSFYLNGYSVLNIHSRVTGAYTNGGAADVIRYVLNNNYLYPISVISFGICFGADENGDFNLGDAIISKKVYPYFIGAKVKGEQLKVSDDNVLITDDKLAEKIEEHIRNNVLNRDGLEFAVGFGNYITGEAVVSSREFRKKCKDITKQEILAGDMEAYGVYKECKTPPYSIPCLVLKSICDWGVEKNFDIHDNDVIFDYGTIVLGCKDQWDIDKRRNEIINSISSLMDRLQAHAAKNSFEVLKALTNHSTFNYSSYSRIKSLIEKKRDCTNFEGEPLDDSWISDIINNILSEYNVICSDEYAISIATLLSMEGLITNLKKTGSNEFVFDIIP